MSSPLPPEIRLPNGQTGYLNPYRGTYTTSRAYAQRMQRNFARGLTLSEARGHRPSVPGVSESQLRRQQFQATYGFAYSYWQRLWNLYIRDINRMSPPSTQITPMHIQQALQLQNMGALPPDWIETRLNNKLYTMRMYRGGAPEAGRVYFDERISYVPIEWWYYH